MDGHAVEFQRIDKKSIVITVTDDQLEEGSMSVFLGVEQIQELSDGLKAYQKEGENG